MARKAPGFGETLDQWLVAEGLVPDDNGAAAIADVARVRAMLIAAARERRVLSYSEALAGLGLRFSRPKMRAFCKTLDKIDADGATAGEPGLAVLVVRESDRLPGQGWWTGAAETHDYAGDWTGAEATALVARLQAKAFDHWVAMGRRD
ncbi:ribose-phosphate pyrophosphokinase [Sphingomonas sp. HITSZ_GF]|uniref:ribose-phosphate pyrophosphokinase n=1 Tax=Sphingomonas sp. HITSZ_GF TaxID=3037247 RepID=UPI00240D11C9|nr:ribose-phosphate pyrophosphokinase [Sphingomonas sp. HITSZ_GF]MDG2532636.1 ribose-phosphate pyrophosphokinase [Sphingomonas sp. HITSZ_GF]